MSEPDIANVSFLIRHHLQMSAAAFRRDSGDPEVVEQLARLVGTEERLKQLCLMTLVDIEAVGPDVMTPWKEDLLWRLYVDTYNRLTLGYGDDVIDPAATSLEALLETLPPDITPTDLDAFLEGLPRRYLRTVDPKQVYDHVRLGRDLGPRDVHCSLGRDLADSVRELDGRLCRPAKALCQGLWCAVVFRHGHFAWPGDVKYARGRARRVSVHRCGTVSRSKRVGRERAHPPPARGRRGTRRHRPHPRPKARGLARRRSPHIKVVVHVDNQYSDRFSIIEIIAPNAWGLLYRISRVISDHDSNIDLVLISTEGDRAIDVFHLTRNGGKLTGAETDSLRDALLEALAAADAP